MRLAYVVGRSCQAHGSVQPPDVDMLTRWYYPMADIVGRIPITCFLIRVLVFKARCLRSFHKNQVNFVLFLLHTNYPVGTARNQFYKHKNTSLSEWLLPSKELLLRRPYTRPFLNRLVEAWNGAELVRSLWQETVKIFPSGLFRTAGLNWICRDYLLFYLSLKDRGSYTRDFILAATTSSNLGAPKARLH